MPERFARACVLLAVIAAVAGVLLGSGPSSGWLTRSIAAAWCAVALIAVRVVPRRFRLGEVLLGVLAVGPGSSFLIQALGDRGASVLDAVQALLVILALVAFALARRAARDAPRAGTPAESR